ncbi:MAG: P-II family nitrogen regulator [Bacteroidia bacterium]
MKEIKAFIRPLMANSVCKALKVNGYCCMTLTSCEGMGNYTDPADDHPSLKFPMMHSKVVKIEMVYPDKDVDAIINIIQKYGKTGHPGDGIIYLSDIQQVFRVKNGQSGKEAFS